MTDAELHELVFLALAQADTAFQFWLTATFAVIVVAFLAPKQLSGLLVSVISLLYVLTTVILVTRLRVAGYMYRQYVEAIEELPFPIDEISVAAYVRPVILVLGTVATVGYLLYCYRAAIETTNDINRD